jgi:hypothetical protein
MKKWLSGNVAYWPLAAVDITEIHVFSMAAIHRKAEVCILELRITANAISRHLGVWIRLTYQRKVQNLCLAG